MKNNRVKIGKNVRIGPGVVLGGLPFIFNQKTGERVRPEIKAGIVIEDNVDIAANSVVNLGWKKDTIIRENVMIGVISLIGHDSEIGKNTGIAPHVSILGHVKIGEWCFIAPQTVVKSFVKIGDYTMIGMGSVVTRDIPNGVIAYGTPCKVIRENKWRPQIE